MARPWFPCVAAAATWLAIASTSQAITLTSGFTSESVLPAGELDTPVAIAFTPDGRLLIAEKAGRVWVVRSGAKLPAPMLDIQPEVLNSFDRGMLSLAVDPNYAVNHFVYFLYTVDPDSDGVESNGDAYGRLVRYQTSAADSNVVDPTTRTVLFGTGWRDGPIIGSQSHTIGSIRWASDGSMLVSMGDGAQFNGVDAGGRDPEMFGPALADPYEDIGAYRAQNLWSMSGKILRIDPANGHGYPSNPFWDGDPMSVRSRVWEYGLRNAFRFAVRPGTGSANPADANPGTLYIGDVGWNTWEELDVARTGGLNFGWPCYEGPNANAPYLSAPPSHGGCDSIGTTWNPADVTPPLVTWNHEDPDLSVPPGLKGSTGIGGVFYNGTRYPNLYRNHCFIADYTASWIKLAITDENDQLIDVLPFASDADGPVDLTVGPRSGDLYYVAINAFEVRRIRYANAGGGNLPPVASAGASPLLGAPPLAVTFSSAGTYDLDADSLSYSWTFGDGWTSANPNPTHTYTAVGLYDAILTVEDDEDSFDRDTIVVSVTNMPSFPATFIRDNFNRPNGAIGGAWVGNTTGLVIDNHELAQPTGGEAAAIWNGAVFDSTQEAYCTIDHMTPNSVDHGVLLKVQGTSSLSGLIEVRYDDFANAISVWTYSPSQDWVLRGGPYPYVIHDGDQFGGRAFPDGRVEVYVNRVRLETADCSGWEFAHLRGRIGLAITDGTESRIDNFGGGSSMLANHPPHAGVIPPVADSTFFVPSDTLTVVGLKTDLDDPQSALLGHWSCQLVFGSHSDDIQEHDGDTTSVITPAHDDSTGVYLLLRYIVTDTGGLKDTADVHVFPENDLEPSPVTMLPNGVASGGSALVHFAIRNHGRLPTRTMHWMLRAGGTELAHGDTAVAALDSVTFQRSVPIGLLPGDYDLRLTVDTLGVVVETNESNNSITRTLTVSGGTLAVGDGPLPLSLSNPWPNPTSGRARLALTLPAASRVGFTVLDIQGRVVWSAPERVMAPGRVDLEWDGRRDGGARVHAGLYLARVTVDGKPMMRRVAIIH